MNQILDSFIIPSPTGVTTNLGAINILGNRLLTHIPEHFRVFDQLKWINLDKNNISSIKPGTFDNLSGWLLQLINFKTDYNCQLNLKVIMELVHGLF